MQNAECVTSLPSENGVSEATSYAVRFEGVSVGFRGDVTSRNDMIVCSTDEDVARKFSFRNDAQDIRVASVRNVNWNR